MMRAAGLRRVLVISYADASWANSEDMKSQLGRCVVVTDVRALDGSALASLVS